jgi:hypothetical protein
MFNNNARRQSEHFLRLNWVLTGDHFRPLRSTWSPCSAEETPMIGTPRCSVVCNAVVTEKCNTSGTRAAKRQARSLTMSGR